MVVPTVKADASRVLAKLEFNKRVQIAQLAHDAGEVPNGWAAPLMNSCPLPCPDESADAALVASADRRQGEPVAAHGPSVVTLGAPGVAPPTTLGIDVLEDLGLDSAPSLEGFRTGRPVVIDDPPVSGLIGRLPGSNVPGKCAWIQRASKVSLYVPVGVSVSVGFAAEPFFGAPDVSVMVRCHVPASSDGGAGAAETRAVTLSSTSVPSRACTRTVNVWSPGESQVVTR